MADLAPDQLEELRLLHQDARCAEEGGVTYVLLSNLSLPGGCTPPTIDALLCPSPRDGYDSRLFFASQIQTPSPRNWNGTFRILDRNWYAFSWRLSSAGLRIAQVLAMHLRTLT